MDLLSRFKAVRKDNKDTASAKALDKSRQVQMDKHISGIALLTLEGPAFFLPW